MSTLAQLKVNVSGELGLDQTAAGVEDTRLERVLNEAVLQVLLETRCYMATTTAALAAGTKDYDLQTSTGFAGVGNLLILSIDQLIDSNAIPLEPIQVQEIYNLRRASSTASAGQRKYALDGANLLMVWPTPASAETLTLYYVPRPTVMSSGSHDPSTTTYGGIPAEYHPLLEFYALWRMASYDDDSSSNQGDRYFGQYQLWLSKMKRELKLKGARKLPRARIGRKVPALASDPART